ncbi:PLP-dependent aminotransferase family protein [Chryseobacterium sp.]|uniref:aminotransferase-like domain-containing protein n=1 Tax=Chryseobacterium sp. TaxID=1871047 RepID=UPI0025C08E9D|nr:PLP-dependent aminotransferase family protein [Chryseobacterium sp.]MBV8324911.1 PLP-dependent aminotransferase family protein [Chryseobacterium sp.]
MRSYQYEVFTTIIEEQILSGILKTRDRLPSVREIKKTYQLSTSSVQSGFEHLIIKGLVESIPRSGYFVAEIEDTDIPKGKIHLPPVVRDEEFMKNILLTSRRTSDVGSFNTAIPGDLMIPQKLILRTMQEVIREKGASLLRYYPSNGLESLRTHITKQMGRYGGGFHPDELVITDGALQALTIALRAVTKPGDVIVVDSPCVFSVLEVIANLGLKVIEIPVHYADGFDTEYFRRVCHEYDVRAIVVTPNFHNPTGILMTDETKKDLLAIALVHQIPVIENDMYSDLYFTGSRPKCIKSFDETGLVMTYSSFSKTLAPGIRLGWLSTGRFYAKVERSRFILGRSVSPVYQELVLKLLQGNTYERHLRSFRKKLSEHAFQMLDILRQYFPDNCYFHRPEGGYSIWARFPENINMEEFYQYCEEKKLLFTPGHTFSFTEEYSHHFRIVFADRMSTERMVLLEDTGKRVQEFLSEK